MSIFTKYFLFATCYGLWRKVPILYETTHTKQYNYKKDVIRSVPLLWDEKLEILALSAFVSNFALVNQLYDDIQHIRGLHKKTYDTKYDLIFK